mmetsp:Transcript_51941/g.111071  ORF Transcript_51941/g.111071 Transcript_51941/m.111071 type:complete len:214 (+) Transcript_51941:334-975(+)
MSFKVSVTESFSALRFGQGASAVIISITVQPKLQMSDLLPALNFITSGAIQKTLPWIDLMPPVTVLCKASSSRQAPKSASLASPCASMRMFAPLTSRCTIFSACKNSRPSRICLVYLRTSPPPYGPNLPNTPLIEPLGMNSRKINSAGSSSLSCRIHPWYCTILACLRRFSVLISRSREPISFSAAFWPRLKSSGIFLTAMNRPATMALKTSP